MKKILCLCFSATYQRTVVFDSLKTGDVNRANHYGLYASGKALNSARVLAQLQNGCVESLCPLGPNSREFIELAAADKLQLSWIDVPWKIRECWTLLDSSNHTTTELIADEKIQDSQAQIPNLDIKILKLISQKLDECDALLLAGSRQGSWPEDIYPAICGIALDKGKILLADFIGDDLKMTLKSAVPSIIKINDQEFTKTFGLAATKENICQISSQYKNIIVITRGADSTLAARNGQFFECPVPKIQPVNTIACGDSFNAGFLYEYLQSNDMSAALQKGTWCAVQNALSEVPGSILA